MTTNSGERRAAMDGAVARAEERTQAMAAERQERLGGVINAAVADASGAVRVDEAVAVLRREETRED